jgi:hypothetical protein
MPFPLIAIVAKKLAAKGAQKVAAKGASKVAEKGAQKGVEKGTQNFAQKGLTKFGKFEKENWKSNQKANQNKEPEQDSDYGYHQVSPPKFHKGGRVKKSGLAEVKKGEVVLTEKQQHELAKHKVGGKTATKHKNAKGKTLKKYVAAKR